MHLGVADGRRSTRNPGKDASKRAGPLAITDTTSPQLRTRALQLGLLADTLDIIAALRGIRGRHPVAGRRDTDRGRRSAVRRPRCCRVGRSKTRNCLNGIAKQPSEPLALDSTAPPPVPASSRSGGPVRQSQATTIRRCRVEGRGFPESGAVGRLRSGWQRVLRQSRAARRRSRRPLQ